MKDSSPPIINSLQRWGTYNFNSAVVPATDRIAAPLDYDHVEPPGSLPEHRRARLSGWGEPYNLSTTTTDITKIQAMIRMAERGNTYQLFTYFRDRTLGSSKIQAELGKRKLVVVGQVYSLQPWRKDNPDDVKARDFIQMALNYVENWDDGLAHLLDATIWPVAVCEKIYEPVEPGTPAFGDGLRVRLKHLYPVEPVLLSYQLPYLAPGGFGLQNIPAAPSALGVPFGRSVTNNAADTVYDPDAWEPNLRFYRTFQNGVPDFSWANLYAPDPIRHIIHRGSLMTGIRDNYGGPFRAITFWDWLANSGRDWWARFAERYGAPFPVIKANTNSADVVANLQTALSEATKIFGLVLNKDSECELMQATTSTSADAYKLFVDFCNDQISELIVGRASPTNSKGGGGGEHQGGKKMDREVRQDIRQLDQKKLNNTVRAQVFKDLLALNGVPGLPPRVVWGGADEADSVMLSQTLANLRSAMIKPTEDGLDEISEKTGINLEFAPEPEPSAGGLNDKGSKKKPSQLVNHDT